MHIKALVAEGKSLTEARKVLIMVHGRGGNANDILSLSAHLELKDFAMLAPQATNNEWYPYSFLAPPSKNEPWLSSALNVLDETVNDIVALGFTSSDIFFLGFSQGACLVLEYVARHAKKYGGVIAFTGGLIGDKLYRENYSGDFESTAVFIGTSDPDAHVPVERVNETSGILENMHASVTQKVYSNMGHTINQDEINEANSILNKS